MLRNQLEEGKDQNDKLLIKNRININDLECDVDELKQIKLVL